MGSTTASERFLTLLRATYVIPAMFSDLLKSTQAFLKERPWLLWIVIAQANLSGSWCLSAECSEVCENWVMGQIGTHLGNEELNYHTYWKTWCQGLSVSHAKVAHVQMVVVSGNTDGQPL